MMTGLFLLIALPLCGIGYVLIMLSNCPHETTYTIHQTYESGTQILLKKETICNRCGQLIDTEY